MYHIISYELFYTWVHMLKCVIITIERWDEAPPCKFKLMSELMMLHAHQEIMKRLLTYYNFLRRTGPALKQHWKCLREPGRSVGFGSCCSYRAGLTWIPIKQRVCVCGWSLSHVKLFMVSWTEANQGPLTMGFYMQEHEWATFSYSR